MTIETEISSHVLWAYRHAPYFALMGHGKGRISEVLNFIKTAAAFGLRWNSEQCIPLKLQFKVGYNRFILVRHSSSFPNAFLLSFFLPFFFLLPFRPILFHLPLSPFPSIYFLLPCTVLSFLLHSSSFSFHSLRFSPPFAFPDLSIPPVSSAYSFCSLPPLSYLFLPLSFTRKDEMVMFMLVDCSGSPVRPLKQPR